MSETTGSLTPEISILPEDERVLPTPEMHTNVDRSQIIKLLRDGDFRARHELSILIKDLKASLERNGRLNVEDDEVNKILERIQIIYVPAMEALHRQLIEKGFKPLEIQTAGLVAQQELTIDQL